MNITISGSLGNIGKPLTQILVTSGHRVTVISSSMERKNAIEDLGAIPAIGSVSDPAFLRQAFAGADAVFAMTPPNLGGKHVISNTTAAGKAIATALKETGVKRVVMLSSIGADHPDGNGPIAGLYNIEQLYKKLEHAGITYLRAGFFYTNFYNDISLIKNAGVLGANYPATIHLPMVHPADIAVAAAEELQTPVSGHNIRYVISDVRTPGESAGILGAAIGRPGLPWVQFTDEQSMQGMTEAGLPGEIAGLYTEMGYGIRSGKVFVDFEKQGSTVTGKIRLEDFAREFAAKFAQ